MVYPEPYYRLVYGDSDFLPGLVIDRFGDICVVQIATAGMEKVKNDIVEALVKVLSPRGILFKNDGKMRDVESLASYVETAYGDVPDEVTLIENGVSFLAPIKTGQKTGWFYDHRESRAQLAPLVKGKRVLDIFSYVGGWGVQAAAAGASHVTCIDASASALEIARKNAALNGVDDRFVTLQGDAFELLASLKQSGEKFDVVVIDPPAFITRRKDHKNGLAAYRRANELAIRLLQKDGLLVSGSCSLHLARAELIDVIRASARHLDRNAQIIHQGHQGADHPVHPAIAETEYLKAVFSRILLAS
jgi:23S rRNA (cytosine1962-C5)-methyltransferase